VERDESAARSAVSDEKHHYSRWSVTNPPQEVLLVMKNITTATQSAVSHLLTMNITLTAGGSPSSGDTPYNHQAQQGHTLGGINHGKQHKYQPTHSHF
jgi:hypothetical protein